MNNRGFTLIELIVGIVIIGIGVAAFAQLINSSTVNSVDPQVRQQANSIARAYLEEVMLRSFCDPDIAGDCPTACNSGNTCSNASCTENTGGTEIRSTFDDICDYELPAIQNATVQDQLGNPVADLSDYRVTVDVIDNGGADFGGLSGASSQSLLVEVNVTHVTNPDVDVTASGYRANY